MSINNFMNGWLEGALKLPTDNFTSGLNGLDYVIIHCISLPAGEFGNGNVQKFFCNQHKDSFAGNVSLQDLVQVKVSAHFFIDRLGAVSQFVSINDQAWHAGVSSLAGITNFNTCSIGIELEGLPGKSFTNRQYSSTNMLLQSLQRVNANLQLGNVFAHADIAPDRRDDPGSHFDWRKIDFESS